MKNILILSILACGLSPAAFAQTAKPAPDAAKPDKPGGTVNSTYPVLIGQARETSEGVPTRIKSTFYFLPETNPEFVVEFPGKPTTATQSDKGFAFSNAKLTLAGNTYLTANLTIIPEEILKRVGSETDAEKIKGEEKAAALAGVKNPKASIQIIDGKTFVATTGTISDKNQKLKYESRLYYGTNSFLHVAVSAPIKSYPTDQTAAFLNSVKQKDADGSFTFRVGGTNLDVGSDAVLNGRAVKLVEPAYPPAARMVRVSGAVNVMVLIDEKGFVIAAEVVSGHPLLRAAAIQAARGSQFTATVLEGKPVKVQGVIVYNFTGQ